MDPRDHIPHRPPFLFLDSIDELDASAARGQVTYRSDEPFFIGHFPGNPVVPGVLQIETMAQLVAALGMHAAQQAGLLVAGVVLVQVRDSSFFRPLFPGNRGVVRAQKVWLRAGMIEARAQLHLDTNEADSLVAEATIRGAIVNSRGATAIEKSQGHV